MCRLCETPCTERSDVHGVELQLLYINLGEVLAHRHSDMFTFVEMRAYFPCYFNEFKHNF